ncbi:beta-ketoacyl-[acyl-carrier-protein] synthase II [Psittacicella hinzii]|uniref:3-oxoacyl-[acyl-carrier-protein] synthase 2 n=1 Tax=Psittacicella hinzii TaxID=2028575 RepID=A0A3A1Y671_9GAMM|nr:beta-ketoacyl-ACP synthase II [Psittacicella hinzii]RIY33115.1 beta-ketoacyl-[acyl-carrier-protein] synthase II [Psittacicella hinzii]
MTKRRVVVTGMGILSPLGNNLQQNWDNLLAGKSGIRLIEHFDTTNFGTKFAGLVDGYNASEVADPKEQRKMDLFIQYALYAGKQALEDADLIDKLDTLDLQRFGVAVGSGIGGLGYIEQNASQLFEKGPRRISPFFIASAITNMAAGHLSIRYGLKGPNIAITTACTTGTHNIGMAAKMIAYGDADLMLAGGAEKASTQLGIGGFGIMHALSSRNDAPEKASRPWDKDRDGFVLGDGAGVLVLESLDSALARGAKIYAEVVGFGMSGDGYHMTSPPENGEGAQLAMENAIKDAKIQPSDIDYVNAHGTSTPVGDLAEIRAIQTVLGEGDYVVTSTKSMTGHLLGAAGAIESIYSILSCYHDVIPPTINLENPEEEIKCKIAANAKVEKTVNYAINNNFGFGGTNASVIFKKYTG